MNITFLERSKDLFFTVQRISEILGILEASSRVLCSRYVKNDLLMRLKKNVYILKNKSENLTDQNLFRLSNVIQSPSYVSLMSALSFYQVSTQVTRNLVEAISPLKSKEFDSGELYFKYIKIDPVLFFGFKRNGNFFIATPEKAFMDGIYLESLKRYSLDVSSIDFSKLSRKLLFSLSKKYPKKAQQYLKEIYERFEQA